MRHLTFLGALRSGFRAAQLLVGLVLGKAQGAQGAWGHQQDTQPQGAGRSVELKTTTEPSWAASRSRASVWQQ